MIQITINFVDSVRRVDPVNGGLARREVGHADGLGVVVVLKEHLELIMMCMAKELTSNRVPEPPDNAVIFARPSS